MAPKPKQPDPSESKMDILSGIFGRRDEEEEVVVKSVSPTKYRFKVTTACYQSQLINGKRQLIERNAG